MAAGVILVAASFLAACDKIPVNGLLDGFWQLTEIETPDSVRQVKSRRVFLSIQLQMTQWQDYVEDRRYFSHFRLVEDSIFIYDLTHPSQHSLESNNDEWVTAEEMADGLMDAWGLHSLDLRFRMLRLTSDDLVLQREDTIWHYRRF